MAPRRILHLPLLFGLALLLAVSVRAEEEVAYTVEVVLEWTAQEFPDQYPANPHFSGFFGVTHNGRFSLFADGATASSGLGLVATNGRSSVLKAELQEASRRNRIGDVVETRGLARGAGEVSMLIRVTEAHNCFSFVTMVAPSPDWFTGVSGVVLNPKGDWLERLDLSLWVWDAGVDRGETFTAPNAPVQPRESVRLAAVPSLPSSVGAKTDRSRFLFTYGLRTPPGAPHGRRHGAVGAAIDWLGEAGRRWADSAVVGLIARRIRGRAREKIYLQKKSIDYIFKYSYILKYTGTDRRSQSGN